VEFKAILSGARGTCPRIVAVHGSAFGAQIDRYIYFRRQ